MINLPTVSSAECQKMLKNVLKKFQQPEVLNVCCLVRPTVQKPQKCSILNDGEQRKAANLLRSFFFVPDRSVEQWIDYQNCNLLSTNLLMTHFYGSRGFAAFLFEFWTVGWTKTRSWRRHVDLWELFFFSPLILYILQSKTWLERLNNSENNH